MQVSIGHLSDKIERLDDNKFAYLLLTPGFVLLGVFALWPLLNTLYYSFYSDSIFEFVGVFVGPSHYIELLTGARDPLLIRPFMDFSQPFSSALPVTLIITVFGLLIMVVLGFIQALVMNVETRFRGLLRMTIILPWATPVVIFGMVFYLFFQPGFGAGTDLYHVLLGTAVPLAYSRDVTIIVIIAAGLKGAPFVALVVLAGLQSISQQYYDICDIQGATRWQKFRYITFPLTLPALLVAALFSTISLLKVFGLIIVVGGNCVSVPTLSCLVYETYRAQRYGTAAALAFITSIVVGLLILGYLAKLEDVR